MSVVAVCSSPVKSDVKSDVLTVASATVRSPSASWSGPITNSISMNSMAVQPSPAPPPLSNSSNCATPSHSHHPSRSSSTIPTTTTAPTPHPPSRRTSPGLARTWTSPSSSAGPFRALSSCTTNAPVDGLPAITTFKRNSKEVDRIVDPLPLRPFYGTSPPATRASGGGTHRISSRASGINRTTSSLDVLPIRRTSPGPIETGAVSGRITSPTKTRFQPPPPQPNFRSSSVDLRVSSPVKRKETSSGQHVDASFAVQSKVMPDTTDSGHLDDTNADIITRGGDAGEASPPTSHFPGDAKLTEESDSNDAKASGAVSPGGRIPCQHCKRLFFPQRLSYHESVCSEQKERLGWDKRGVHASSDAERVRLIRRKSALKSSVTGGSKASSSVISIEPKETDSGDRGEGNTNNDTLNALNRRRTSATRHRAKQQRAWISTDGLPSGSFSSGKGKGRRAHPEDASDASLQDGTLGDMASSSNSHMGTRTSFRTDEPSGSSDVDSQDSARRRQNARHRLNKINARRGSVQKPSLTCSSGEDIADRIPLDQESGTGTMGFGGTTSTTTSAGGAGWRSVKSSMTEDELREYHRHEFWRQRRQAEENRRKLYEDVTTEESDQNVNPVGESGTGLIQSVTLTDSVMAPSLIATSAASPQSGTQSSTRHKKHHKKKVNIDLSATIGNSKIPIFNRKHLDIKHLLHTWSYQPLVARSSRRSRIPVYQGTYTSLAEPLCLSEHYSPSHKLRRADSAPLYNPKSRNANDSNSSTEDESAPIVPFLTSHHPHRHHQHHHPSSYSPAEPPPIPSPLLPARLPSPEPPSQPQSNPVQGCTPPRLSLHEARLQRRLQQLNKDSPQPPTGNAISHSIHQLTTPSAAQTLPSMGPFPPPSGQPFAPVGTAVGLPKIGRAPSSASNATPEPNTTIKLVAASIVAQDAVLRSVDTDIAESPWAVEDRTSTEACRDRGSERLTSPSPPLPSSVINKITPDVEELLDYEGEDDEGHENQAQPTYQNSRPVSQVSGAPYLPSVGEGSDERAPSNIEVPDERPFVSPLLGPESPQPVPLEELLNENVNLDESNRSISIQEDLISDRRNESMDGMASGEIVEDVTITVEERKPYLTVGAHEASERMMAQELATPVPEAPSCDSQQDVVGVPFAGGYGSSLHDDSVPVVEDLVVAPLETPLETSSGNCSTEIEDVSPTAHVEIVAGNASGKPAELPHAKKPKAPVSAEVIAQTKPSRAAKNASNARQKAMPSPSSTKLQPRSGGARVMMVARAPSEVPRPPQLPVEGRARAIAISSSTGAAASPNDLALKGMVSSGPPVGQFDNRANPVSAKKAPAHSPSPVPQLPQLHGHAIQEQQPMPQRATVTDGKANLASHPQPLTAKPATSRPAAVAGIAIGKAPLPSVAKGMAGNVRASQAAGDAAITSSGPTPPPAPTPARSPRMGPLPMAPPPPFGQVTPATEAAIAIYSTHPSARNIRSPISGTMDSIGSNMKRPSARGGAPTTGRGGDFSLQQQQPMGSKARPSPTLAKETESPVMKQNLKKHPSSKAVKSLTFSQAVPRGPAGPSTDLEYPQAPSPLPAQSSLVPSEKAAPIAGHAPKARKLPDVSPTAHAPLDPVSPIPSTVPVGISSPSPLAVPPRPPHPLSHSPSVDHRKPTAGTNTVGGPSNTAQMSTKSRGSKKTQPRT